MSDELIRNCQRVCARIDLDAVRSNMEQIKSSLTPGTKIIAVLKAEGYGHGALPIARELEGRSCVSGFALATAEEAFRLRREGIKKPLLVLGYAFPQDYERMIDEEIRITVFRYDTLRELSEISARLKEGEGGRRAKVHIKVDTGMNRIGIRPDGEGLSFVERAFLTKGVEVEGIYTHFARADEADKTPARKQLLAFEDFLGRIREKTGREIPVKHCANSAGLLELPHAHLDAVRAGIILYGLWPSDQVKRNAVTLTPAMSLYSQVVYVKEIQAGEAVSYGGTFLAQGPMRIATVPVGYGDGYPRSLSNKGYVLVRGKAAPVVGRICMDQFMIDVTKIPEAAEGDKVTLIGRDKEAQITMEQLGSLSGRFNYEFACCIGKRVPRVYVKDGRVLCVRDGSGDF